MNRQLFVLSIASFAIGTGEFIIVGLLPRIASTFAVSIPAASWLVSAYALSVAFGSPILILLLARANHRFTAVLLLSIFSSGTIACAAAPAFSFLVVARVVTALAHGAFFGVGTTIATESVSPDKRGQAVSLLFLGLTIANVLGVPAGTFIAQVISWRVTLDIVALLGVVSTIGLLFAIPSPKLVTDVSWKKDVHSMLSVDVAMVAVVSVSASASLFALLTYISPTLTEGWHVPASFVPGGLFIFGTGLAIGGLVGGRLADGSLRGTLVIGLSIIVGIMSLVKWLAASVVVEAIFLLSWGIAAFSLNAPLQLLMVEKAKAAPRLAATLNQSAFNLGDAAGAWAGSALLNSGAGYGDLPLLSAGLALTSLFFVCFTGMRTEQIPVTNLGETK
jgi:DHA1 family inner membrane transport protein